MQFSPKDRGQGIVELILILVLVFIVFLILYNVFSPSISTWINNFLKDTATPTTPVITTTPW
jgi:hypothetical protein